MKLNQNDLESGRLSTVNLPPAAMLPARPSPTPPYRAAELNMAASEPRNIYQADAIEYVKTHGYVVVASWTDALKERGAGRKVLSLREADIANRGKLPLGSPTLQESILHCFLMEDQVCKGETVYTLRAFYNRGVAFVKDGRRERATPEVRAKADATMAEILQKLTAKNCPAYESELTDGFPEELTKPEFMTFAQYQKAATSETFDPNQNTHDAQETHN